MDDLTTTPGIVALAAGGLALVAFVWVVVLGVKLRRVREAFVQLRDWVEESAAQVEGRMATAEQRIDGCVAHTALIRFDAWGEMSGRQSSTMALLDANSSGVVVSSILHRDHARVYVKQVREGESELELSPEEREAIEAAMAGTPA